MPVIFNTNLIPPFEKGGLGGISTDLSQQPNVYSTSYSHHSNTYSTGQKNTSN